MERLFEILDYGFSDEDIAEISADVQARSGSMHASAELVAVLALIGIALAVWLGTRTF